MNNRETDFTKYIFVDECSYKLNQIPLYHIRAPASRPERLAVTRKNDVKINVWGGISIAGPTNFAVILMIIKLINCITNYKANLIKCSCLRRI